MTHDHVLDLLLHEDPAVRSQGEELCRMMGPVFFGGLLRVDEGFLTVQGCPWSTALLTLLCDVGFVVDAPVTRLCLAGVRGMDALLPRLVPHLPALMELDLSGSDVTDLRPLQQLPSLSVLHILLCPQLHDTLTVLPHLPELASLSVGLPAEADDLLSGLTLSSLVLQMPDQGGGVTLPETLRTLTLESDQRALGERVKIANLSALRLTRLCSAFPLEASPLDLRDITWLELPFHPRIATHIPVHAFHVSSHIWRTLSPLCGGFRTLQRLHLVQHRAMPLFRDLEAIPPIVLDLSAVDSRHHRGWPQGAIPSTEMYRLRRRCANRPDQAVYDAHADRWRAEGFAWALEPGAGGYVRFMDVIRRMKALTGYGQFKVVSLCQPAQDRTAEAYRLPDALRIQGLLMRAGVWCRLVPWR